MYSFSFLALGGMWKIFWTRCAYIALIRLRFGWGSLAHCIAPLPPFPVSVPAANRRCDHILRFGISAGRKSAFVALLSYFADSAASVVVFGSGFFSKSSALRTKDRN